MKPETPLSERLLLLRKRLDLDQGEMGKLLEITRAWVSKLENGREEFSPFMRMKLAQLEQSLPRKDEQSAQTGNEAPTMYQAMGAPTKVACLEHLGAYLDIVEGVPSGLAHAWMHLQLHFPLAQAEALKTTQAHPGAWSEVRSREYLDSLKNRAEANAAATRSHTAEPKRA